MKTIKILLLITVIAIGYIGCNDDIIPKDTETNIPDITVPDTLTTEFPDTLIIDPLDTTLSIEFPDTLDIDPLDTLLTEETVCNVENPLTDLPWLKEYCENLDTQNFSSIYIHLYRVIGTNEHLFKIAISYSEFDDSPFAYSEGWKNCTGNHIFSIKSGVPHMPGLVENFMKDKEFVAELFHLVKQ